MDMKSKGITVRPIQTIDAGHEVNEVFFDDVEVAGRESSRRGEPRAGITQNVLLGNERTGIARVGVPRSGCAASRISPPRSSPAASPSLDDQGFREKLAAVEIELKALELTQLRVVADREQARQGQA